MQARIGADSSSEPRRAVLDERARGTALRAAVLASTLALLASSGATGAALGAHSGPACPGITVTPARFDALAAEPPGDAAARRELAEHGITRRQWEAAYSPGLSERYYLHITPLGYEHLVPAAFVRLGLTPRSCNAIEAGPEALAAYPSFDAATARRRADVWSLYLGLPQRHGTFRLSEHRPSRSSDETTQYFAFAEHEVEQAILARALEALGATEEGADLQVADTPGVPGLPGVMRTFTVSRGRDERGSYVAYYDVWDLHPGDDPDEPGTPAAVGVPEPSSLAVAAVSAQIGPTLADTLSVHLLPEASLLGGAGHALEIYGRVYDTAGRQR